MCSDGLVTRKYHAASRSAVFADHALTRMDRDGTFGTSDEFKALLNNGLSASSVAPGGALLMQLVAIVVEKTKLPPEGEAADRVEVTSEWLAEN